jgi:uncharacterized repeat protein (TIGR01451 family)
MKSIKTSISAKLAALLFGAALFGLVSHSALAAGTLSGTSISNTATLSYSVATVAQTAIPATTTFVVDDKVNVLVAGGVITNVTPGQNGVLTPFTVTNSGNATQGYNLVAADAASGAYTVNATGITDNFDPAAGLTIYRDNDCNGAINGADAVVTTIPTLPPNAGVASTACLLVQTDIAGTQVNGDAAVVSLKATTVWPTPLVPAEENTITPPTAGAVVAATGGANTTDVDVVLADGAGVVAGDIASDGAHSTYGAYRVNSVNVALTKTVSSVVDPSGTAVLMPNAVMTYKIDVVLTGSGTADNLVITDPLPANTAYLANSITVACISGNYAGGGACGVGTISTPQSPVTKGDINTDADYADFNFTNVNTVTVTLGNVTAPANFSITFKATIN